MRARMRIHFICRDIKTEIPGWDPGGFPDPYGIDITEIDGFDNLHHAEGILKDAMETVAAIYGADRSCIL